MEPGAQCQEPQQKKNNLQAANPPGKAAPPKAGGLFHTELHPPGQLSQGSGLHSLSP